MIIHERGWWAWLPPTLLTLSLVPATATAIDFRNQRTGIEGLVDIELAYGLRLRTQNVDPELVGIGNGGSSATRANFDDGTLNYDDGELVSHMLRTTGELTLRWRNFGAFFRGYAFYDYENEEKNRERTDLTEEGEDQVGSDAQLLDAYVSTQFTVRDIPLQFRLGDQVVDWGESRFFPATGINIANPLDIPLFQQPTSTERDLRRPVGTLWGLAHLTPFFSVEGYYQYDWQKTVLPAVGTFFSINDALDPGGRFFQGAGVFSDFGTNLSEFFGIPPDALEAAGLPVFDPDFLKAFRTRADRPGDSGQFGITLQSILPKVNDTKFALHFINYHSKIPVLGFTTPSVAGYRAYSQQAIQARAGALVQQGVDSTTAAPTAAAAQLSQWVNGLRYFTQYPDDIQMLGLSFNTTSLRTGTAYFGEIAHHFDAPLPVHPGDLLPDALPGASRNNPLPPVDLEAISAEELAAGFANQRIDAFIERDKTFLSVGATQLFGPQLGAAQTALNLEFGWLHIWDMPSKSDKLISGPGLTALDFGPRSAFASTDSWGYRLAGALSYPNVFGGITLRPRFLWSHDVDGVSPQGAGPFRRGRKTFTFGLGGEYINRVRVDLAYTTFWGAGEWNMINDRDNLSFSVRYDF